MKEDWGRNRGVGCHIEALELLFFPPLVIHFMLQIYNDRRLFFAGGPGVVPNDSFGPVAPSGPNADRRSSRGRGITILISTQLCFEEKVLKDPFVAYGSFSDHILRGIYSMYHLC